LSGINIEEFFRDAAKVLSQLHSVFPHPNIIEVSDICGIEDTDEYGMHSPRHLACFATLLWLAEEGYIRFAETIRSEGIDQAVLTARCFVLLTRPVTAKDHPYTNAAFEQSEFIALQQASLIHALHEALQQRSSLAQRKVMLSLMSAMLNG
jgi:hypothetical protein